MNAGWMFTIPVYDRMGNGYIFDSDFITAEEAKAEVEALLGHEITVGKQIDFDPGAVDRPWIGNCCAIGLSASFIEPLEASSIGTSINQTFLLCEKLINYTPAGIKKYNDTMDVIIDNIRDFIALHYMSDRRDTPFWRAVSESEIPDSLADQLGIFQQKLPRPDDFYGTQYMLFNAVHYFIVMHGLGLFDINSIREEYFLTVNPEKQQEAAHLIQQGRSQPCEVIPHRTMLDIIRNLKKENK
jgi:tryptophan halogenase